MQDEKSLEEKLKGDEKMKLKEDVWYQLALEFGFRSDNYYSAKDKLFRSWESTNITPGTTHQIT